MSQIELALNQLRGETLNMWNLVQNQLEKAHFALIQSDKNLARALRAKEKRINSMELKIDRDCEQLLALFAPVAVDLRFVLASLKINTNLERIGDVADSVAHYILQTDNPYSETLINESSLSEMFQLAQSVLTSSREAFEFENTYLARTIFQQDEALNRINNASVPFTINYMEQHPEESEQALQLLSIIRKLERVGDHAKNIAEETIFYVEAKVMKHKKLEP